MLEPDVMGLGTAIALVCAIAWHWGRSRLGDPDPGRDTPVARGAWKFAPVGVVVGVCVAVAAAFARCSR